MSSDIVKDFADIAAQVPPEEWAKLNQETDMIDRCLQLEAELARLHECIEAFGQFYVGPGLHVAKSLGEGWQVFRDGIPDWGSGAKPRPLVVYPPHPPHKTFREAFARALELSKEQSDG